MGQANNRIHGSPDFMAHIGQEFTLRPCRRFRLGGCDLERSDVRIDHHTAAIRHLTLRNTNPAMTTEFFLEGLNQPVGMLHPITQQGILIFGRFGDLPPFDCRPENLIIGASGNNQIGNLVMQFVEGVVPDFKTVVPVEDGKTIPDGFQRQHQQHVTFFLEALSLPGPFFIFLLLGDVARYADITDDLPLLVNNGGNGGPGPVQGAILSPVVKFTPPYLSRLNGRP